MDANKLEPTNYPMVIESFAIVWPKAKGKAPIMVNGTIDGRAAEVELLEGVTKVGLATAPSAHDQAWAVRAFFDANTLFELGQILLTTPVNMRRVLWFSSLDVPAPKSVQFEINNVHIVVFQAP